MRIKIQIQFKKQYFLLDKLTKKRLRKAIIRLRKGEINLEKLTTGQNIYKIRVGDYRILIEKSEDIYFIVGVELRKDVYKKL
jgi:mRNA-degrading endonuclease RelE of RelBE toxin-antitoxin system